MTLGERLTRLRNQRGLSQDDLADILGVSRQSVSKWETDASVPELSKLMKLSDVFGVSLDELAGRPAPEGKPAESAARISNVTEETLRFHRQRIAGMLLLTLSVVLIALFFNFRGERLWPLLLCSLLCLFLKGLPIGPTCIWGAFLSLYGILGEALFFFPRCGTRMDQLLGILQLALLLALVIWVAHRPPALPFCWLFWGSTALQHIWFLTAPGYWSWPQDPVKGFPWLEEYGGASMLSVLLLGSFIVLSVKTVCIYRKKIRKAE